MNLEILMKKRQSFYLILLVLGILSACTPNKSNKEGEPATTSTEQTSIQTTEQTTTNQDATAYVKGNDDIGYLIFSTEVVNFTDVNHDETVANTRQWMNPDTMGIISLTSYIREDYTDILNNNPEQTKEMSELDVAHAIMLEHFQTIDGAEIKLEKDYYNDLFHESNLSFVTLPNGLSIATITFLPEKDSKKLYILSAESDNEEVTLSWIGEMIHTWSEKNPTK